MDQRTEQRVRDWDSRSLAGGYDALRDLADGDFSGAVVSVGDTWLFMLNGRVVGVFQGVIEDFEAGDATVYQAPDPSLPLLFTMLENGGEQRARYYTEDTPISEAHSTLSDAQFTGYIELSENVLSGDYYVVYYGGRSMSCAFVGSSERLLTGDEAFAQADDEVGIYQVRTVDIDVVDIPEPAEPADDTAAAAPDPDAHGGDPAESDPEQGAGGERVEPDRDPGSGSDTDVAASADPRPEDRSADDGPATEPREAAGSRDPEPADRATAHDDTAERGQVPDRDPPAEPEPAADPQGPRGREAERSRQEPDQRREPDRQQEPERRQEPDRQQEPERRQEPNRQQEPERRQEPNRRQETDPQRDADRHNEPGRRPESEPRQGAADRRADAGGTGGTERAPEPRNGNRPADRRAEPEGAAEPGASQGNRSASEPQPRAHDEAAGAAPVGGDVDNNDGVAAEGDEGAQPEPIPKEAFTETERVPSLDPERTGTDEAEVAATPTPEDDVGGDAGTEAAVSPETVPAEGDRRSPEVATGGAVRSSESGNPDPGGEAVDAAVAGESDPAAELRSALAAREQRIEELEADLADLRVQRDGLRDERDELREEVADLEAEIADLEAEIESLRNRLDDGMEGRRRLSEEEALQGTDLFIRYGTKSAGTLADAHAGDADADAVNKNLRLEHHTQFDAEAVAVDGRPFEEFFADSIYRDYVEWVVRTLLYEIRDSGNVKMLKELYDALPDIDRVELLGEVAVEYTEDGETYSENRQFDVVLRDRKGNPLVVADVNDSRNPATEDMMEGVVENASEVKSSHESLAGAMLVTASFFQPGALETADEAAGSGGGLMGGSSRESFVKLSRKQGYHLLLVEARDSDFHINVPEL